MPERDLRAYAEHLNHWRLPSQRQALQLARLSQLIDVRIGHVDDAEITDYLFDAMPTADDMDPMKSRDLSGFFD